MKGRKNKRASVRMSILAFRILFFYSASLFCIVHIACNTYCQFSVVVGFPCIKKTNIIIAVNTFDTRGRQKQNEKK